MKKYSAVIGSMTQAIRAQKALASQAIRSEIIMISSVRTKRGCVYGIEFASEQLRNVDMILNAININVKEYRLE